MSSADFSNVFIDSENSRIRYHSGLCVYDEAFIQGRLVGRAWNAAGFPETEGNLAWMEELAVMAPSMAELGIEAASFEIAIDGQRMHFGWELVDMRQEPTATGGRHAIVELRSTMRPITVRVHTEVAGNGFITRWLEIENTSDKPAALGECWVMSGLLQRITGWRPYAHGAASPFRVGYMTSSSWGEEGFFDWQDLPPAPLRIESRAGKSGHGSPWCILENQLTGGRFVMALQWSANWGMEFTADYRGQDAIVHMRVGPTAAQPQRVIEPGETVTTPKVHIAMLQADLDECVQTWHRHIRANVLTKTPDDRRELVAYNHWAYNTHEMREDALCREIDVAAKIGAEVFIVDAGWYGPKGTGWYKTVGDWTTKDRLPNGLRPVSDYAHEKGLRFGLWFDIERMGPDSQAGKEHPERWLKCYGKPMASGDLDLTGPENIEHIESAICRCIDEFNLDVFRLDYNACTAFGGQVERDGWMENAFWRQHQNIHAMYARIRERYPDLLMENCASGGGRTDMAMMAIFDHTQISDWSIAPRAVRITNGMTMSLPPERVMHYVGVVVNTHTRGSLDLQMRMAVLTHFGISGLYPRAEEANPVQVERVKHHIDIYKNFLRPFMYDCRVYHHTPVLHGTEPGGFCALEYGSADFSRAVAGVFRLAGKNDDAFHLRLRSLDAGRQYRVTFDNTGQSVCRDGAELMQDGVHIRLDHALSSELLLIEAV